MLLHRLTTLTAAALMTAVLVMPALAQTKQRIEKAADLPRFTYPLEGKPRARGQGRSEVPAVRGAAAPGHRVGARASTTSPTSRANGNCSARCCSSTCSRARYDDALKRIAQIRELRGKARRQAADGLLAARDRSTRGARPAGTPVGRPTRPRSPTASPRALKPMPYPVDCRTTSRKPRPSAELVGEALLSATSTKCCSRPSTRPDRCRRTSRRDGQRALRLVLRLPLKQTLIDDLRRLPRRQQGRQARHLGGARCRARAGTRLHAGRRRGLGQRRRHRAVQRSQVVRDATAAAGADRASTSTRTRRQASCRSDPGRCRPPAADEVAQQGLLRPAVERRQSGSERGQADCCRRCSPTSTSRRSRSSPRGQLHRTARTSPASRWKATPTRGCSWRASSSATR